MASCPQCGRSVGPDDVFCSSCGFALSKATVTASAPTASTTSAPAQVSEQPMATAASTSTTPRSNFLTTLAKQEERVLRRLPLFSVLDFWLLVGGLLFLYAGISEIVLHYGPGLPFAIGAIFVALVYVYLARTYHRQEGEGWILQVAIGLPFLCMIGDFIVTGIFTSLSALLTMINLTIIFTALKELQIPPKEPLPP